MALRLHFYIRRYASRVTEMVMGIYIATKTLSDDTCSSNKVAVRSIFK